MMATPVGSGILRQSRKYPIQESRTYRIVLAEAILGGSPLLFEHWPLSGHTYIPVLVPCRAADPRIGQQG